MSDASPPSPSHPHLRWQVGTIGFSYGDWQPEFYPASLRPPEFLASYAARFDTVELDTTFHAIPPVDRVKKWADTVPAHFTFCPKTPKQITHDAPIAFGVSAMRQFLRSLAPMHGAGKLGPILLQFPPTFAASEAPNLRLFLSQLPATHRYAVELRHDSWEAPATAHLLAEHRCAWVSADYAGDPYPITPTTDFLYLRFIGVHGQFAGHGEEQLDTASRLSWWLSGLPNIPPQASAYALFNNDYAGHAPATANRFRRLLGLPVRTLPVPPAAPQQSLF